MSENTSRLTGNIAADAIGRRAEMRFMPLDRPGSGPTKLRGKAASRTETKGARTDQVAQLRKATQDFEAVFLTLTLKQMRSTIEKGELFHGGTGEDVFTEMLDEEFAKKTAATGHTGLAELLFRQLSRQYLPDANDAGGNGKADGLPDASQAANALMRQLRQVQASARAQEARPQGF